MYCIFVTNKNEKNPGILTSWSVYTCVRLTGWPGQNHRSGVAPPEWECWEPSCHHHQRSVAAEGDVESVRYKHAHTYRNTQKFHSNICINNVM